MARKLNKNVVGLLTLVGMALLAVIGIVLIENLPGQDPKVFEAEAKRFEEQKEYGKARQNYAKAYQKDPAKNPEYLVMAAKAALEDGDLPKVFGAIQQARVRNAQLRSAAELATSVEFELANLSPSALRWHRVLEEAQKLTALGDESQKALHALGAAYLRLSEEDESYRAKGEEAIEKAWQLDPSNPDVVETLAGVRWGQWRRARDEGRTAEAKGLIEQVNSIFSTALEKSQAQGDPSKTSALKRLQALYQILTGSPKEGIAVLEALANEEKAGADAHLLLARIHAGVIGAGIEPDMDKAAQLVQAALEIDPANGEAYLLLGDILKVRRGNPQDTSSLQPKDDEEMELYKRGLEKVAQSKHFRSLRDNMYRESFFVELCLQQVDRAQTATSADEKAAALEAAEGWIESLKKEVDLQAQSVRLLTAHILNARGDYVAAIREAEAAEKAAAASPGGRAPFRLYALLGELYMRQRQWGSARESITKALTQRPNIPMLFLRMAQINLAMNQPNEALQYLKPARPPGMREFLDRDPQAIRLRVEAYNQLGQYELAKKENARLGEGSPDNNLREAQILFMQGQHEEAEAKIKPILESDLENLPAIRLALQIYGATNRKEQQRQMVEALLKKDPSNREYKRLELAVGAEQGAPSDDALLEYLKEEPDEFTRAIQIASFYAGRDKPDEAAKYLDEAERIRPNDPNMLDRQFRNAIHQKDWEKAERYVRKDMELNTDGTEGKMIEGRLALAKKDFSRAIELMRVGLAKYPNYSLGWTYLAEAYMAAGQTAEAKATLQRALATDPTNAYANRGLAEIAIRENDERAALTHLKAAAEGLPEDAWVRQRLQILREREKPQEGIAAREKIRQEDPKNLENLVLLARLYAEPSVAAYDKATAAYREALEISKDDLSLARELAGFLGREGVNRPDEGEALLKDLMKKEEDAAKKALIAVYLSQFYETQDALATADRHIRLAVSLNPSAEVLAYAAEFCTRTNRLNDALEYYERVVKTSDVAAAQKQGAQLRTIAILLTQGDLDRAKEEIDAFVAAYPDDPQGMVYRGAYHRLGGDIQKAKEAFDGHLEKDPDNALALWQRGQLFVLMGQYARAIADLSKSKAFSPDGFAYQHRMALAEALVEAGKADEAVAELRSILDQRPEEAGVAAALIDLYMRLKPPRLIEAENLIYSYMREYPKDSQWPMKLGLLGEKSGKWDKAVEGYEKAAELSRNQPQVVKKLFEAYRAANRVEDMIHFGSEKLTSPNLRKVPTAMAALAWAYSKSGDEEKCFEVFDQALSAAGEDFIAYTEVIGQMVQVLGKEEVLARAQSRAEADPQSVDRKKTLVHLLYMNGKYEDAIQACGDIARTATRKGDLVFAELGQGMLLEQLQRYPEAKERYEAALKIDPDYGTTLNNLAFLLVDKMNNAAEALPYAAHAKKLQPNDADVLDTLGWIQAKNALYGEAIGTLLRALDIERDHPDVLYHLGEVYLQTKDLEEAKLRLEAAQRSAEAQGRADLLPKIRKALEQVEKTGG